MEGYCVAADDDLSDVPNALVASVELTPDAAQLSLDERVQLDATARDDDGEAVSQAEMTWASSHPEVATVSEDGAVEAVAPGATIVSASAGNSFATATVTVVDDSGPSIEVSPPNLDLAPGESESLTVSATDEDGEPPAADQITWESDAPIVADVDQSGLVTAVDQGTALISATADGESVYASVKVADKAVASVAIDDGDQTIESEESAQLTATVSDVAGNPLDDRHVIWSSDEPGIVVVDSTGQVTGVSRGEAVVRATSEGEHDEVTITVTSNRAPTVTSDDLTTPEDTSVDITLSGSDPDNDDLTFSIARLPDHGGLEGLDPDTGAVTYVPYADYSGPDEFTFTAADQAGATASATVSLTVDPVNDAPFAADDTASTTEDAPVTIPVLGNDGDPEGDSLTVALAADAHHGSAVVDTDTNAITYTPDAHFNGRDRFSYTVSDGESSDTADVHVSVSAENDSPIAADDTATTDEDHHVTVAVLANDSDPDGDALTVEATTEPNDGTLVDNGDGTLTYIPDANFNGTDSFSYTVTDGEASDTAGVNITISAVNDTPVAASDTETTNEDNPVVIDVLANDTDPDTATNADSLTIVDIIQEPLHGDAWRATDDTIVYHPHPDFHGTDLLVYTITDAEGATASTWATVTVEPVNDDPVAHIAEVPSPRSLSDNSVRLDGSASADVEPGPLAYSWSVTTDFNGRAPSWDDHNAARPTLFFTRAGEYTVTLEVTDQDGATDTDTITFHVVDN